MLYTIVRTPQKLQRTLNIVLERGAEEWFWTEKKEEAGYIPVMKKFIFYTSPDIIWLIK
jgi:hypothetical protein